MTDAARPYRTDLNLTGALYYAEGWAEDANNPESRAYWRAMRDTLRVLLGVTVRVPTMTTEDPAASVLLGPFGPSQSDPSGQVPS